MAFGFVSRALLSSVFIADGADGVRDTAERPGESREVVQQLLQRFDVDLNDDEAAQVAKLSNVAMIGAGGTMALGILPRLSALVLLVLLAPKFVGNKFWELEEEAPREAAKSRFVTSLGLAGALLGVVLRGKR